MIAKVTIPIILGILAFNQNVLFMQSHIKEGKENLNFDEFGNYSRRKQESKLDRMVKQIKSGEMPSAFYTLIHKNEILSPVQKKEAINWINKTQVEKE